MAFFDSRKLTRLSYTQLLHKFIEYDIKCVFFTISVLTNRPGYSIEGNIQCHIVQSYSTTDGYVQSCRKFCQTPVPVGCVSDCMKFCQAPVLIGRANDFQNVLVEIQSCQWRSNKTNLEKTKTRQRHQTLCVHIPFV